MHACAHRLVNRGIEYDELYAAGCEGLIKAADKFDKTRGYQFSTYAVPVILGEMKRLFRDGGAVKVGRSVKTLGIKAARTRQELCATLGREPTVQEIAKALCVSPEDIAVALDAAAPPVSLTIEDDGESVQADLKVSGFDEQLTASIALQQAVQALPEKDRKLIVLRYYQEQTQVKTAKLLGMTQVQVSRREKAILLAIKQKLTG